MDTKYTNAAKQEFTVVFGRAVDMTKNEDVSWVLQYAQTLKTSSIEARIKELQSANSLNEFTSTLTRPHLKGGK